MHHNAASVTDDFRLHPNRCCGYVALGAVFDTEKELGEEAAGE